MELGIDTTARIAADIFIAALQGNALILRALDEPESRANAIAETFTIIHRAVLNAANGTPP